MKEITPETFAYNARMLMEFIEQIEEGKPRQDTIERLLAKAFMSGMKRFAWWQDGTEMVGTCGTTFEKACQEVMSDAGLKGKIDSARQSSMKCAKCNSKIGVGIKVTPLAKAIAKGVPHVEAVPTDYFVRCSICSTEWCGLGCAIEDDAVSHADADRGWKNKNHEEPFVIECCRCTGNKRSWEDRE